MPALDGVTPLDAANVQAKVFDDTRGDGTGVGKMTHLNCKLVLKDSTMKFGFGFSRDYQPGTFLVGTGFLDPVQFQFELDSEWGSYTIIEFFENGISTLVGQLVIAKYSAMTPTNDTAANVRGALVQWVPQNDEFAELQMVAQVEGF